jgi:hypothetical protein
MKTVVLLLTLLCLRAIQPQSSSTDQFLFQASTPCDSISKALFQIPQEEKCEWMKWKLTLNQDKNSKTYILICQYGMPRQGTRKFAEGSKIIELSGQWDFNQKESVCTLRAGKKNISLSFYQPDPNILHLLDKNKHLMVGNGGWSYTLNKIQYTPGSHVQINRQSEPVPVQTSSALIGVFIGRSPCNHMITEFNKINASICQITKWRLTLYQDSVTHMPANFKLESLYVGTGNNSHVNTGKWTVNRGLIHNKELIVYQLDLDSSQHESTLRFVRADDNVLFFLDKNNCYQAGDDYSSYTLNRMNNLSN